MMMRKNLYLLGAILSLVSFSTLPPIAPSRLADMSGITPAPSQVSQKILPSI
jgi:hypothetical protein